MICHKRFNGGEPVKDHTIPAPPELQAAVGNIDIVSGVVCAEHLDN